MTARDWGDDESLAPVPPVGSLPRRVRAALRRLTDPSGDALTATYGPDPNHTPAAERIALAGAVYVVLVAGSGS